MNSNENWTRQEEPLQSVPNAGVGPQFATRYLRFGEFQLDLHREELWRNGERVRLQGKVYQTLLILLSRAGDVVTREEVRRHLWPENPQVNFEANVNTSMNKLRQALSDSPDNPVYIETIPRKGYCFLLKVEHSDTLQPVSTNSVPMSCDPRVTDSIVTEQLRPVPLSTSFSLTIGLRIATLLLAGMIVGALMVLAWFSYARTHRALHMAAANEHARIQQFVQESLASAFSLQ
jgi:DNA-binding winged helix-turn-helix (wHTH) protein